ncbi:glycosyltransferase, partial [Phocaeicola vulgatus]
MNDEKYIKKQLEFILNQTLPIDEIIICDDRSQDNTIQLIKE